jgi:hypothetical protein
MIREIALFCLREIKPYPANVENRVSSSRWQMGFNLAFKGLSILLLLLLLLLLLPPPSSSL